ncbi:MAG: signal transduction histidine kinase [Motiliproteus sp.]
MRSIQTRLSLPSILLTVSVFVLLLLLQGWFLRQLVHDFAATRLASESFLLLKGLEPGKQQTHKIDDHQLSPTYLRPLSGHYYQYRIDSGPWIYSRSLWDEHIPTNPSALATGQNRVSTLIQRGNPWMVREEMFEKQGHSLNIVVAEDISSITEQLTRLSSITVALGLLFLLVLLAAQRLIIRGGLSALRRVAADIVQLKQGGIRQLPEASVSEVKPLVNEINYLVQSMELRLQRSRNAVGNLAHAAKNPLTVIDRQIEKLQLLDPECAAALRQQSLKLRSLMERELTRARICGSALPGRRIYIHQELEKLQRTLQAIHRDKELTIQTYLQTETYFPGERDDLVELLGNLLDNACKWAVSQVQVRGTMDEHCLELCIEDDGPGIEPAQRQHLLDRGVRLDESTSGHGLGLSIVTEIVRQYEGRFDLCRSDLGGLKVHVFLPLQRDSLL